MENGACVKNFPRDFCHETRKPDDAIYPTYRRRSPRDGGATVNHKGHTIDNRWVVPHSTYLLLKYRCHLNVEACVSVKGIKYMCVAFSFPSARAFASAHCQCT